MKARITGSREKLTNLVQDAALATAAATQIMLLSVVLASAQEKPPVKEDITAGKVLAMKSCAKCHGEEGLSSTTATPHLAGQFEGYISSALMAYKEGRRSDKTMIDITRKLGETDIANIAAYYSSLNSFNKTLPLPVKGAGAGAAEDKDPFADVRKAIADCAACHGEDGNSKSAGIPSLAGQHAAYQIAAMKTYKDGTRPDETMQALAAGLSPGLIEDMAYFYAAMEPKRTENVGKGDAQAGVFPTASCAGCHGVDGNNSDPKVPRLAGLDADYLALSARAYKSGKRQETAMKEAMASFREADINNMASYYASREPKALPLRKPLTTKQWVVRCDRCHGSNGNSSNPKFPILAGQNGPYLVKALKHYHMGERKNQFMFAMSFPMTESDIQKLARYYARQRASK